MTPPFDEAPENTRFSRSRLLLALRERDRLERVLLMLPRVLSELTAQSAAETLAEAACVLADARLAVVTLPDLLATPALAGPDAHLMASVAAGTEQERTPIARTPITAPALNGHTVYVPDTAALDHPVAGLLGLATDDGRQLRCLSALPLAGGEGVLLLAHHRANAFSDRQIAQVGALVSHVSHVIEASGAVSEQTRIATALQETLLPPLLPTVAGVELAARYRPSGSGNLVGGDFYDVFMDGVGGWYLLLGDVSGLGPEAAGLAGIARYTARALAGPAPTPDEMLAKINLAVLRAAPTDRFCTAVLVHVEKASAQPLSMSLASSGHPPPYVLRRGGIVEPATQETGTLLGIMEEAPIGWAQVVLEPGDAVVFYTDGITEAHSADGTPFGDERLCEVLSEARNRSAEGIARRLERAVLDHRAPDDRDDMAIVVVRVRPSLIPT